MSIIKQALVATAVAFVTIPAAFATSGTTSANNQRGYTTHAMPASGLTRAQVKAELAAFMKNPVAADGARYVGGDTGWVYEGHKSEFRNGRLVHTDNIDHNAPKPSLSMTPEERALYRDLYSGG